MHEIPFVMLSPQIREDQCLFVQAGKNVTTSPFAVIPEFFDQESRTEQQNHPRPYSSSFELIRAVRS